MIQRAYAIFDKKALTYNAPFFQPTDGLATRMFGDLANDANTMIGRHPSDFVLYLIGSYDDQKGRLEPCDPLVHVVDAINLLTANEPLPFDGARAARGTARHG